MAGEELRAAEWKPRRRWQGDLGGARRRGGQARGRGRHVSAQRRFRALAAHTSGGGSGAETQAENGGKEG
jgi:hypothetical protein